jgi:hypothetical protein
MIICKFCGTTFTTRYNLSNHIKSAKYCLAQQNKMTPNKKCAGCDKVFSNEHTLNRHLKICKLLIIKSKDLIIEHKDAEIKDKNLEIENKNLANQTLQEQVSKLEEEVINLKLENSRLSTYEKEYLAIRDKPTTTYNSTTNRLKLINISTIDPFTITTVQKRLQSGVYSYDEFLRGLLGIQEFILNMVIKGNEMSYTIVDVTRPNYQRLQDSREWVIDVNAHFIGIVFDELKPTIKEYYDQFNDEDAACKTEKEHEKFDVIRERIIPVYRGIIKSADAKDRKTLQSNVISYIKPRIVAPSK